MLYLKGMWVLFLLLCSYLPLVDIRAAPTEKKKFDKDILTTQRFLKRKTAHKFKRVKEGNLHYPFTCITVTMAFLRLQKFSSTVKSAIILNIVRWRGRFPFLLPVPLRFKDRTASVLGEVRFWLFWATSTVLSTQWPHPHCFRHYCTCLCTC